MTSKRIWNLACATLCAMGALAQEPNPPKWDETSVKVFSPGNDAATQQTVNDVFAINGGHEPADHGQFSPYRFALLFKPGTYAVDVPVGFYTQVMGMGMLPTDVKFTGAKGVFCEEGDYNFAGGALDTFWRSAENFATAATYKWIGTDGGMMWAVSQASPIRRVDVEDNLFLYEYQPPYQLAGYSSGGFMANIHVNGTVSPGSQQQFFARNCDVQQWSGGVWNIVLTGVKGAPPSHCSNVGSVPIVNVAKAPVSSDKPWITIDATGKYSLVIPGVQTDTAGVDWSLGSGGKTVGFEQVYVATNASDTASTINAKLAAGRHVVLSPGVYNLTDTLAVVKSGQVLLGLGVATLISGTGKPVISVADSAQSVRIAGVLLQAGPHNTSSLLQWGSPQRGKALRNVSAVADPTTAGFLHDVYARVGGPDGTPGNPVTADTSVHIYSNNVVGDNMWLWRADHTVAGEVSKEQNPSRNGMVVDGDDVTMYGLAIEHHLQDQLVWNGENGKTFFFQCELPYDVTPAYGTAGYVGYRVNDNVKTHVGYGVGVYSNFVAAPVAVARGIAVPDALVKNFESPLSVFLNGQGGINHVINTFGEASQNHSQMVHYWCGSQPPPPPPSPPGPPPPSPPSPPSPPPPGPPGPAPTNQCPAATPAQCQTAECSKGAPYMCTGGAPKGGCNSSPTYWPAVPQCTGCIDTANC